MTNKDQKHLVELIIELGMLSRQIDRVKIEIEDIVESELDES